MELRRYLPVAAVLAATLSASGCAPYDEPAYTYYLVPCAPGAPLSQSVTAIPPPAAGQAPPAANNCIAAVPNGAYDYGYGYGYYPGAYPGYDPWYGDYAFGAPFFAPFGVVALGHHHFHDHDRDHDHDHDRGHFDHGMRMGGVHGMHAGVAHGGTGHAGGGHGGGGHGGGGSGGGGHRG